MIDRLTERQNRGNPAAQSDGPKVVFYNVIMVATLPIKAKPFRKTVVQMPSV